LLKYLNKDNFFFINLHGFRQKHSTSSALTIFNEFISNSIDKNEIPMSIFLDLSKAFDTLDHSILLTKMHHFGIRGVALQIISDYLSRRTQRTYCNNSLSSPLPITCGVPQGSILGPLLFLIYINDIHKSSSLFNFIMLADDTTLLFSVKSLTCLQSTVNNELDKVSEWLKTNKLSINISKTNYMIFKKVI